MRLVRIVTFITAVVLFGSIASAQTATAPAKKSTAASGKTSAAPKSAPKTEAAASDLVDINHATAAELKSLTGIGEAYSVAIIKNRPYKNKTQLRSQNVIPPATYEKIKDKIIAKQ